MKKLSFFIFCFYLLAGTALNAQNWQTVYSDRVQYFDSGVNAINIISFKLDGNGTDSIFFNYPALVVDNSYYESDGFGDSVSWLGKRILIKSNGANCFVNGLDDTLIIKTNAKEKESWEFLRNSNTLIIATIDSISYRDYNGFLDSVKHISLSVIVNSSRYKLMVKGLDKKQIWLSKYNGFIRVPILEYILNLGWNSHYYNVKPVYNQFKANLFTNKNMFDFEIGDIVHSSYGDNQSIGRSWSIETYIDKAYGSLGDSVQYKISSRFFSLGGRTNPDTTFIIKDTSYTYYKTYYNLSKQAFGIMPFSLNKFASQDFLYTAASCCVPTDFSIRSDEKCKQLAIYQTENYFEQSVSLDFFSNKGFSYTYRDGSRANHMGVPWTVTQGVSYVKNSCGEEGSDVTLFIHPVKNENSKVITFPNPANNLLFIEGELLKSIAITDVSGKVVFNKAVNFSNSEVINVSSFANGIYLIKTETSSGMRISKVVVQH
jgi:hypothetical protein